MKFSFNKGKVGLFAAGVLFGTAGLKILGSDDAKGVYAQCTAAVLRAKDCVVDTAVSVQENAEDILAEAQMINEERAEEKAMMEEFDDAFEAEFDDAEVPEDMEEEISEEEDSEEE